MPRTPDPITSTPEVPGQPWDATDHGGAISRWEAVDGNSGPADAQGNATGRFEDGPGPWRQT